MSDEGSQDVVTPSAHGKMSGKAIASLICSIMGIVTCGVGSVLGFILGLFAFRQIRKSEGALTGSGLALTGVLLSVLSIMPFCCCGGIFTSAEISGRSELDHLKQLSDNSRTVTENIGEIESFQHSIGETLRNRWRRSAAKTSGRSTYQEGSAMSYVVKGSKREGVLHFTLADDFPDGVAEAYLELPNGELIKLTDLGTAGVRSESSPDTDLEEKGNDKLPSLAPYDHEKS